MISIAIIDEIVREELNLRVEFHLVNNWNCCRFSDKMLHLQDVKVRYASINLSKDACIEVSVILYLLTLSFHPAARPP